MCDSVKIGEHIVRFEYVVCLWLNGDLDECVCKFRLLYGLVDFEVLFAWKVSKGLKVSKMCVLKLDS